MDVPSLVIGLQLMAWHADRLSVQRFNRPAASGGMFIGTMKRHLRATYLLDRKAFVVECREASGAIHHSAAPVQVEALLAYVLTWLYCDYGEGFDVVHGAFQDDAGAVGAFWSQAYGRLLGLPDPPLPPDPPRTIEQQRTDGLIHMNQKAWVLPEIQRLTWRLKKQLDRLETASTAKTPSKRRAP